jgi:CRP-like cAMP-binding protein
MADQDLCCRADNGIIASLPAADQARLARRLEPVRLKFRQRLEVPNQRIRYVHFVERGLVSVIAIGKGERRQAEVGLIGREGMTGLAVLVGADRSPHEMVVQIEGAGQRIAADDLRRLAKESVTLAAHMMRYFHIFAIQAAHTALANAQGRIEERLARWLLMARDRTQGDDLALTHELLAVMLGVRRAGVTAALNRLEEQGLICTSRGCVRLLDRDGLLKCADGLYGVPEAELDRLFTRL